MEVRLNSARHVPPVWLMGLSNTTPGFSNGFIFCHAPAHGRGARARAEDCCDHCGRWTPEQLAIIHKQGLKQ
jgi:hypothetical protein